MKKQDQSVKWIAGLLFLLACGLALTINRPSIQPVEHVPRATWADRTPMGGAGLRLLLERLDYRVRRADEPLQAMPKDARVWLLLDPQTTISTREAKLLAKWVQGGGTLIWAVSPPSYANILAGGTGLSGVGNQSKVEDQFGLGHLQSALEVDVNDDDAMQALEQSNRTDDPLPQLTELEPGAPSVYWSGVKEIHSLDNILKVGRPFLEIAGTEIGTQIARIRFGRGLVIVTPDPMLFTNYALGKPDNAVFVSNLIRLSSPERNATVYFDERRTQDAGDAAATEETLFTAIWKSPARYAILQLGVAALLVWALYGRRLGAPVPLPDSGPVTRASQFATAMGGLFQKAGRAQAAAQILAEEFRRALVRRLGLSSADPDHEIARRAGEAAALPPEMIERLLQQVHAPTTREADALNAAQEMEYVLRRLKYH